MPAPHSPQDLDPIGGLTARLMTLTLSTAAIAVALGLSVTHLDQVTLPLLQLAALVSIAAAAATLIWFSSPYRAPFRRGSALLFLLFAVLAMALDAVSQSGGNASVRDDWPPISIALLVLMLGTYRPAREALLLSPLAAVAVGAIAAFETAAYRSAIGIGLSVIVVMVPVVAAGAATTAFSHRLVEILLVWRRDSASAQRDTIDDLRSDLIPSVRAERIELLESEVLPFLRELVASGTLTADASDRSRALAAGLRDVMSPDSGRNWLEELADNVDDPERLLERMGSEQRGSLRALLVELRTRSHVAPGTTNVRVHSQDRLAQAAITADVLEPVALRASLAPYFAVARGFLPEATLHIDHGQLLLEFRFETR